MASNVCRHELYFRVRVHFIGLGPQSQVKIQASRTMVTLETAIQVEGSNRRKLPWSEALVVSVTAKAKLDFAR